MIFEAHKGETEADTAAAAFKTGCIRFLHNDRLFQVSCKQLDESLTITWKQTGVIGSGKAPVPKSIPKSISVAAKNPRWDMGARVADAATRLLEPVERIAAHLPAQGRLSVRALAAHSGLTINTVDGIVMNDSRFVQDDSGFWMLKSQAEAYKERQGA